MSLASLFSVTIHGAVFIALKPHHQSTLPNSVIYRPTVATTIGNKSTQPANIDLAASTEVKKNQLGSVEPNGYQATPSLKNSSEKKQLKVESNGASKFSEEAIPDLNAVPTVGWILNTESVSAAQVVTMILQLTISKTGELDDYFVIESTASKEQTEDILKNFRSTSFAPAFRDGKPASNTLIFEIKVDNLDSLLDPKTEQR